MRVAVFDSREYDKAAFLEYGKKYDVEYVFFEDKLSKETASLAKEFDAVCVFVNDSVDKDVIDTLYSYGINILCLRCAGFNNVDIKAAFGKVHVYRVSAYSPYSVAEHAIALLLTSNRRIHKAYNRTKDYNFSLSGLTGEDLFGKTIGVIGTGKIGKVFINICKGFGMHVLAYDKYPDASLDVEYVSLDDLFKRSDFISLHCPLTEENAHMINESSISIMKKGVGIINTSRGGLIDGKALLEGIK